MKDKSVYFIYHLGYLISLSNGRYIVHLDKSIHNTLDSAKERINFLTK